MLNLVLGKVKKFEGSSYHDSWAIQLKPEDKLKNSTLTLVSGTIMCPLKIQFEPDRIYSGTL